MNQEEKLVKIPFHHSLQRPNLLFGADREMILSVLLVSATLIFLGMTFVSAFVGIAIYLFFSFFLRRMAKADPLMRHVYIMQLMYKGYYRPFSTPFARTIFRKNKGVHNA